METVSRTLEALGTHIEVQLPASRGELFGPCFAEFRRIEDAFSRFKPSSELSRLNARLGTWQVAAPEMVSLLSLAESYRQRSHGLFDITLKAELERLGYDPAYSFKERPAPPGPEISGSRTKPPRSGPARAPPLQIDAAQGRVMFDKEVDLGGIGKGYALDRGAAILRSGGVSHYCINAGGDILAQAGMGEPPWPTLLEHPDDSSRAIGRIDLDGKALAGSAPNRRRWGKGLHHLLDPRTGRPAEGMKAVFVLADSGAEADAYAKAVFVAGFEGGVALAQELGVEILSISAKDELYSSPGFGAELFAG